MSQACRKREEIDPYSFVTDSGTAKSSLNTVQIYGSQNVSTEGSGSTITIRSLESISEKTGTYTLTANDYMILCTSGTFTLDLPTAVSVSGKQYEIKNSGTGIITVDALGSETIDGEETINLIQDESITIISNGTDWYII